MMSCSQNLDGLSRAPSAVDLSIVIVSYNTAAMTLAALKSVYDQTTDTSFEIIVVDNASADGSAAAITNAFPNVQLIASPENLGFARANNLAVAQARGRYVLLLNPDTLITNGAIDKLMAFSSARPDAKIWGGRTVFADGSLNPASCWGRMTVWNLFCRASGLTALFSRSAWANGETFGAWHRDSERPVDIVSGCFLLIERDFWRTLGGFDPAFFMYGEEADLCLRARILGARPMITPTAEIVHYGAASDTVRTDKMIKLLAAKMSLIHRHMFGLQRVAAALLLQAWPLSRAIATSTIGWCTGRADLKSDAETWWGIWSRRGQWHHGWPTTQPLDAAHPASAANDHTFRFRFPIETAPKAHASAVQGSPRT